MGEIYLSRQENNKILSQLPQCKISFECKQKRLSPKDFWDNYEQLTKYTRIKGILCSSGLTEIPLGKERD